MKYLVIIILIFFSFPAFSQKAESNPPIKGYEQYKEYEKQLYIDNLLKEKIPPLLYQYYYKNISTNAYVNKIDQEYDTVNKIHKLYLYTQKAGRGFLFINKEVSNFLESLPQVTDILYIKDQDTIVNSSQVLDLISLKEENIQNVKYRKSDSGDRFIVHIITQ